jgi:hypothetical protein
MWKRRPLLAKQWQVASYSFLDHPMYDPLYVGACDSGGIEVTFTVSCGLSQMQPLDPVTPLINTHNRPSVSHVIG